MASNSKSLLRGLILAMAWALCVNGQLHSHSVLPLGRVQGFLAVRCLAAS
jgi:hypothetical protein